MAHAHACLRQRCFGGACADFVCAQVVLVCALGADQFLHPAWCVAAALLVCVIYSVVALLTFVQVVATNFDKYSPMCYSWGVM